MIRIATWNIERPRLSETQRQDRLIKAIGSVNADVWILTETHACISPGPEFSFVTTETPDRPHELGESWVSIWSRFPIETMQQTSDPSRAVAARIFPEKNRPLIVYGTVLPWLGSAWRGIPSKGGDAFSAALAAQLSDWVCLQQSNPQCDFVLGGDLNQDLSSKHYYGSRKNRAQLNAALSTSQLACLTAGNLDPIPKHAPKNASIDHICISCRLALIGSPFSWPSTSKPEKNLSDHFGVVVDLVNA